jgi:hypothetical protein
MEITPAKNAKITARFSLISFSLRTIVPTTAQASSPAASPEEMCAMGAMGQNILGRKTGCFCESCWNFPDCGAWAEYRAW